jgi:hypothetical protein
VSPRSLSRLRLAVAVAVTSGLLLCAMTGLGGPGLLFLAPAFVLALTLWARRYPGERLLLAFAAGARGRKLRPAVRGRMPRTRTRAVPRGGLLMGFALAVRPPPCAHAAS